MINHAMLLQILDKYNLKGNNNKLFQSYLLYRFQFVCVNKIALNKRKVTCGVSQGSILGPALFIFFLCV